MKKEIIILTFLTLFTAACNNTQDDAPEQTYVDITISASTADGYTRAAGDPTVMADRCILAIYNADGSEYGIEPVTAAADASGNFHFEPRLLSGRSYRLVFWADKGGSDNGDLYYDTSSGLRSITVKENAVAACNEAADAFWGVTDFTADGPKAVEAMLTRATCRINVTTEFTPATSEYIVSAAFTDVPTHFDAMTGSAGGRQGLVSSATVAATGSPIKWYTYVMAPDEEGHTVDFTMTATANGEATPAYEREFKDIPIQRNYEVNVSVTSSGTSAPTLSTAATQRR
ncbi:MAG: FimB/Mfa2 family fimbrial subunit [Alistipes sp.]|nr:FimB/Mfa2 family fimbrial subunit [Alistipes sp.]